MGHTNHRTSTARIDKWAASGLIVACLSLLGSPLTADDLSITSVSSEDSQQLGDTIAGVQPPGNGIGRLEDLPDKPVVETVFPQPVTSVARQPSTVRRSPAAVFVIDQEMIHRSGSRSIPELLRMVPGLHVARIDGTKWSISSRGYSSRFARKLLVQIDGRMVYTQLFGGTFWDVQDLLLEDIERIEVIRGPGATIWGANAVNGVINIITKSAGDTHGVYAEGGGGTEERGFAGARVGNVTQNGVHWRVSTKWFERDGQFDPSGRKSDDSRQGRAGFRADWKPNCCDAYTFQGDVYTGTNGNASDQPPFGLRISDEPVAGGNLLGRWTRTFSEQSEMKFQAYYDRTDRHTFNFDQNINILDVDFQHRFHWNCYHNVIWGFGYRRIWDHLPPTGTPTQLAADPVNRTHELASAFIQDEITLLEDSLYFTLGTKLSHNTYTDVEVQPTARLLWLPDERSAAWGAVSRAVRTPSTMENDGRIVIGELPPAGSGIPMTVIGSHDLGAEEMMAYEIGYRRQPVDWFSWEVALFYNADEDVVNFTPILPPAPAPEFEFFNGAWSDSYGIEISAELDMTQSWKVSAWYSFLRLHYQADPGAVVQGNVMNRAYPINQAFLMSSWDLGHDVQFDLLGRYVDSLPSVDVPHYVSLDARLAWHPRPQMEISVVGQNLLDSHHPEYGTSVFSGEIPTEVQRGVYGMLTWKY